MSAQDLIALAERCETATGADRILNGDIMALMGWQCLNGGRSLLRPDGSKFYGPLPDYTSSLDAILSLVVGKGWSWCGGQGTASSKAWAYVGEPYFSETYAEAATPALALCAALMRVLAHKETQDGQ